YRTLCALVAEPNLLDVMFLSSESAAKLGVVLPRLEVEPTLQCTVARALWESHWREEWLVLYPGCMTSWAPLTKKPIWELPLSSLIDCSALPSSPLPGLHCLRLETLGRVHVVAFSKEQELQRWMSELQTLCSGAGSDPGEAFVLKQGPWTKLPAGPRIILNSRLFAFDEALSVTSEKRSPCQLASELLQAAFLLTPDSGPKQLIAFLNLASSLRQVDLAALGTDGPEALCFFVNTYHALVKHMHLVLGAPPSAKDWAMHYGCASYSIGGECFSLTELEYCVIRGRVGAPNTKAMPKYWVHMPQPGDDHYLYALSGVDTRINFVLNNGSTSNPPMVQLLTPKDLDTQINSACGQFCEHTIHVDVGKKTVSVPKV
ncbi:unnamed protein product, partial [Chrysoparadoxa australica]